MGKIFLVFIFLVLSAILPFLLTEEFTQKLIISTNFISALATIITLLIALILYSKYGVEKSLINRQTEVVFDLLRELKKARFIFHFKNGLLQLHLYMISGNHYDEYKDKKILFTTSYVTELSKIWQIAEDIFLPPEIARTIETLTMSSIIPVENREEYMILMVPSESKEKQSCGRLNNEDMTLNEFIDKWLRVINETEKWLKEYSNINIDLNFFRKD